jgi:hypothetical protein
MEHIAADRRQKRKDTGIITSKGMLYNEEPTNNGNEDEKELREPDYDEDRDQLEKEQEVETKIIIISRNQVF